MCYVFLHCTYTIYIVYTCIVTSIHLILDDFVWIGLKCVKSKLHIIHFQHQYFYFVLPLSQNWPKVKWASVCFYHVQHTDYNVLCSLFAHMEWHSSFFPLKSKVWKLFIYLFIDLPTARFKKRKPKVC